MNSRVHPKYKTKYRVTNWSEYERGLIQRGDVTVWLSADAIAEWKPAVVQPHLGGRSRMCPHPQLSLGAR